MLRLLAPARSSASWSPAPPPRAPSRRPRPARPAWSSLDNWVTGRNKIWDIAFPQGWLPPVYTENDSGVIFARWSNAEQARPLGAVTQFDGAFDPTGEGGLMGIALEPRLQRQPATGAPSSATRPPPTTGWRASTSTARRAPSPRSPTGRPSSPASRTPGVHNGCRVRFQPGTGALFVSTGDGAIGTAPQSTTVLGGKILRVDMNGTPVARQRVRARAGTPAGHRNPQGLAFRPGSNDPYSVEHGPDVNDEVNKLVNGGEQRLEPRTTALCGYDQSKPMTDPAIEPGNTMTPVWQSGGVTVAPSGGTFLSGPQWKSVGRRAGRRVPRRQPVGRASACSSCSLNGAGTALVEPPRHRARSRRAPAVRGAGPRRQPLRRHRRRRRYAARSGGSSRS